MKEKTKKIVNAFLKSDIFKIKEYTLKFAQNVTRNVLNDDCEQLKDLIKISCEIRDKIEVDEEIERNREFYFGYWYAYENIGRRILENYIVNECIDNIIKQNEDIQKLIKVLIANKAITKQEIVKHLGMNVNDFNDLICSNKVKALNLICEDRIGKNIIYSLNRKGRKIFNIK